MFTGTCFRHAENTIYFFLTYRNTSSCMAYAITKAGVRWFLDSYPMPVPLNLMALLYTDQSLQILVHQNKTVIHFQRKCQLDNKTD